MASQQLNKVCQAVLQDIFHMSFFSDKLKAYFCKLSLYISTNKASHKLALVFSPPTPLFHSISHNYYTEDIHRKSLLQMKAAQWIKVFECFSWTVSEYWGETCKVGIICHVIAGFLDRKMINDSDGIWLGTVMDILHLLFSCLHSIMHAMFVCKTDLNWCLSMKAFRNHVYIYLVFMTLAIHDIVNDTARENYNFLHRWTTLCYMQIP